MAGNTQFDEFIAEEVKAGFCGALIRSARRIG